MARSRYRNRSASSTSLVGWVVAGILGILLVLGGGAAAVFLVLNPFGGKPFFDKGNPNVSADGFQRIEDGMTRDELEKLFGPSYVPDQNDFVLFVQDNPYGRKEDSVQVQSMMAQRQQILAWSRGNVRILVAFHKLPNEGGMALSRSLRDDDGSITFITGDQQAMMQHELMKRFKQQPGVVPPSQPQQPAPGKNTTAAALHAEFVEASNGSQAKYQNLDITITGVIKTKLPTAVWLYGSTQNGTISAMFNSEDAVALSRYKAGDSITFTGKIIGYTYINEGLAFSVCRIVN